MIGGNIRKEVLKRENRYKFYDENNKLIKEEFYYQTYLNFNNLNN